MSIPNLTVQYGENTSLIIGPLVVGDTDNTIDFTTLTVTLTASQLSWEDTTPAITLDGDAASADSDTASAVTATVYLPASALALGIDTYYARLTITTPTDTVGWSIVHRFILEVENTATILAKEELRQFLRDYAENNILLDDVQFTTSEMRAALKHAEDEFSVVPPVNVGGTLPRSLLLLGAASWLMKSESFLQVRNQASYQDGDIQSLGVDDKMQLYIELSHRLKEEWKESVRGYKQSINAEGGYGSISSGYRSVGRYYNN